jgi:hypothetical protein
MQIAPTGHYYDLQILPFVGCPISSNILLRERSEPASIL